MENENPALKSLPLAIQQKQLIVTCNYEARRRGLYKLQLTREARRVCPDVVIVLGEDLTRFRDTSKELYGFLRDSIWSGQAEKLGFDEVWLDCTDMIDYNASLLNDYDLEHSYFCLDKDDPTIGFNFDASTVFGPTYPAKEFQKDLTGLDGVLQRRLSLGSHLARHLRHELEEKKGYTATVGIATNKLLSKLVGNLNKPKNQTTITPPFEPTTTSEGSAITFIDDHDIGKVPGVGFKLAQKIRARVLARTPEFLEGLVYGGTKEAVKVKAVRLFPGMGPEMLEDILSGPGSQKGIGGRIWALLNGVDDTEVGKAKRVPSQISIEDSYVRLDTFDDIKKELLLLAGSLIRRMHTDLIEEDDYEEAVDGRSLRRWLAHPKTLRLSTRPRTPLNQDGSRSRTSNRISRSVPIPNFIFNLHEADEALAQKLVHEALLPSFRKLHPEKSGWNLSLVNIAVTNMAETAAETKDSKGRDIGRMLKTQTEVLKDWKVVDERSSPDEHSATNGFEFDSSHDKSPVDEEEATEQAEWENDDSEMEDAQICKVCGLTLPPFAMPAHGRYHSITS